MQECEGGGNDAGGKKVSVGVFFIQEAIVFFPRKGRMGGAKKRSIEKGKDLVPNRELQRREDDEMNSEH